MDVSVLFRPLSRYFWTRSETIPAESLDVDPPTATTIGAVVSGSTAITLADADKIPVSDANGTPAGILGHITYANLKTTIDTWYKDLSTTFTGKRVTPRITTIVSEATPTINTDNCDCVTITALAANITSMTSGLSGTPTNFQKLIIRIKDDGTARTITWGAKYVNRGVALPTTTIISKVTTVGLEYDSVAAVWGCIGTSQEPA